MFDEIIKQKKLIPEKLIAYGFKNNGDYFQYVTEILNGTFRAHNSNQYRPCHHNRFD